MNFLNLGIASIVEPFKNEVQTLKSLKCKVPFLLLILLPFFAKAQNLEIPYHRIIRHTSHRHDFYIDGLFEEENAEDFLRTVALFWFQFPLTGRDGGIRPHEYDFSVYFSDIPVVSDILFKVAPIYAIAILEELKTEFPNVV